MENLCSPEKGETSKGIVFHFTGFEVHLTKGFEISSYLKK